VSLFLEEGFAIILVESMNLFNFLRFAKEFSADSSSSLSRLQELWLLLFSGNMLSCCCCLLEEDESMILFLRLSFFYPAPQGVSNTSLGKYFLCFNYSCPYCSYFYALS